MHQSIFRNGIKESIRSGRFIYTLEYVPEKLSQAEKRGFSFLAAESENVRDDDRIVGVNIGDRVKSMRSLSTVDCGEVAAKSSHKMPLLHLAGKDRTADGVREVFLSAFQKGLDTFLLVTGDAVPSDSEKQPTGNVDTPEQAAKSTRTRYVDSVDAIVIAKEMNPDCFIAAGVAPFKYREEELMNQYLKMAKKIHAGADYLVTNCGWDMEKYQELIWYRNARGFEIPIVANLLLPALGWAKAIHERRLPGVYMSDDLYRTLEAEGQLTRDERRRLQVRRLALQIVGVKLMGYAGVQLSGVETYKDLSSVIGAVAEIEGDFPDLDQWKAAWSDIHRLDDGSPIRFGTPDGLYLFGSSRPAHGSLDEPPAVAGVEASRSEARKFHVLDLVDRRVFHEGTAGASVVSPVLRGIDHLPGGTSLVENIEHWVKKKALGCEMCGFCRIPYLFYVCPETCPKGLANGPCAGTDENTCEFKDRECIHNRKYRIAKSLGRLGELERVHVPPVGNTRGTSSWLNLYRRKIPLVSEFTGRNGATASFARESIAREDARSESVKADAPRRAGDTNPETGTDYS